MLKAIRQFIQLETASGMILLAVAILALIIDNSPLRVAYQTIFHAPFLIKLGAFQMHAPIIEWINDGLMTLFFLLVGLEIKREMLQGELNSRAKVTLPAIAALGGMAVPAMIYLLCNWQHPLALRGWAIPTATDIAFSLGVLSLLGSRIPMGLKIFLTALAIFDDLGAIIIIAVFYTATISILYLFLSAAAFIALMLLNYYRVQKLLFYYLLGLLLWFFMLQSGVHAVLAGVMLAFTIPLRVTHSHQHSPLMHLEKHLHPWCAFLILPLFGFANAGVTFINIPWQHLWGSVSLGVALGLFLGKQLGVFCATWLSVKAGLAKLPQGANWLSLYGIALICGIGFTMSLFIGALAFEGQDDYAALVRIGVLLGSLLSGVLGYFVLHFTHRHLSVKTAKPL